MAKGTSRREFITRAAQGGAAAAVTGVLWTYLVRQESRATPFVLRPPGAVAEEAFLSLCIKCGLCVADCPFETLRLAATGEPYPLGTPYFIPRENPCRLCPELPCVTACPTGALDPSLKEASKSRMGLAVVVDTENCLSFQGLRCEICYRECPLQSEAITVEYRPRGLSKHALFVPVVHEDACTGCGICERVCPLPEATIKVLPPSLARGRGSEHYRVGRPGGDTDSRETDTTLPQLEEVPPDPESDLDYLNQEAP